MNQSQDYQPQGVIAATLLAFNEDMSIDEAESLRHLKFVADTPGLAAVTVNGHSSEIHACSFDEQRRILDISVDEVGDRLPVINGIYADGTAEAARIARMAEQGGASALLVFPPNSMAMGGSLRPEMAEVHFKAIADATDLPLILFNYPGGSGLGYPFETMLKLFEEVPSIRAIKDWCNDPKLHECHIRTFQSLDRPVNVLTTHSAWLMSSLVMGANGLLSGAGSVIADLQIALFNAIQQKDLARAQALNDRIYPLAQAFYAPPFLDMHNRMKECLRMIGRVERAHVRPPLVKLSDQELNRLRRALDEAGVRADGAM